MPGRFSDRELLFGAAVAQIIMSDRALYIKERPESRNNLFEFRAQAAHSLVLFKYSTKRKAPWQFTITKAHVEILETCSANVRKDLRFVALICYLDGICLLDLTQLHTILDAEASQNGISITRPQKGSYRARGPGKSGLEGTIPRSRWIHAIVGSRGERNA